MKTQSMTTRYFDCTECNRHRFTVDHLLSLIDYPVGWTTRRTCSECGAAYAVVKSDATDFDFERLPSGDRPRCLVLMRLRNPREDITDDNDDLYTIVETSVDPRDPPDEQLSSAQYYFEEHSCPTNFDYVSFILGADPDPHGVWEVLGLMPMWRREGPSGDTHEYLRHIRDAAPELYEKYFKGSLHD